ncbi:hypothetical protein RR46_02764 [Papilio xuthus]|uniref:Uncharacterized protein n=1 Tax=Papilio xuthus TaxID=66420 RepID=A0A194QAD7_PAPXU|nr:hypothetical protein RR46_02764 [Papilio xuthus]
MALPRVNLVSGEDSPPQAGSNDTKHGHPMTNAAGATAFRNFTEKPRWRVVYFPSRISTVPRSNVAVFGVPSLSSSRAI